MKLMLDTNICIYIINRRPAGVLKRFLDHTVGDIGLSAITLSELRYGVAKSRYRARNSTALDEFIIPLEVVPFDEAAALAYGDLRAALEGAGTPVGPMDLLIAAHAVSLGVTLVTRNLREFKRVPMLHAVDWTT